MSNRTDLADMLGRMAREYFERHPDEYEKLAATLTDLGAPPHRPSPCDREAAEPAAKPLNQPRSR